MSDVAGWVAPGFEPVRDAFAANFAAGLEAGAAFAVYRHGEPVVDLWGGVADVATGRPWREDTVVLVFSTTKGATAACAHLLAARGRLDPEAPVARWWPEFAAAGKERVTVAHLLAHQAGLAWVDEALTLEEALAWEPVVAALARQAPHWEPGTDHGYHALTFGWLVGEVVRRVDGRSLGAFFRDEVAGPLGLDFWIGLPEEVEPRVARLVTPAAADAEARAAMAALAGPGSELGRALSAPGRAFADVEVFNARAVRAAEVPAANGVADARSVARMYAAMIGEVDGVRLLPPEQLERATRRRTDGPDRVLLGLDIQFGLGFMVPSSVITVGGPRSFGHFGAGGSVGWADPDAGLAFGYVMNRMEVGLAGDARSARLIAAAYEAAGAGA
jgi:CubicO group peptidase (beta-lactamase class C family)